MEIKLKRIYQAKEDADGFRILVDKIYPRGIKKENLDVDLWDKEVTPSDAVRKAFHTSDDFETFKASYRKELSGNPHMTDFLQRLLHYLQQAKTSITANSRSLRSLSRILKKKPFNFKKRGLLESQ